RLILLILVAAIGGAHSGLLGQPAHDIWHTYFKMTSDTSNILREKIELAKIENDTIIKKAIGFAAKYGAILGTIGGPLLLAYYTLQCILEFLLSFFTAMITDLGKYYKLLDRNLTEIFVRTFLVRIITGY